MDEFGSNRSGEFVLPVRWRVVEPEQEPITKEKFTARQNTRRLSRAGREKRKSDEADRELHEAVERIERKVDLVLKWLKDDRCDAGDGPEKVWVSLRERSVSLRVKQGEAGGAAAGRMIELEVFLPADYEPLEALGRIIGVSAHGEGLVEISVDLEVVDSHDSERLAKLLFQLERSSRKEA